MTYDFLRGRPHFYQTSLKLFLGISSLLLPQTLYAKAHSRLHCGVKNGTLLGLNRAFEHTPRRNRRWENPQDSFRGVGGNVVVHNESHLSLLQVIKHRFGVEPHLFIPPITQDLQLNNGQMTVRPQPYLLFPGHKASALYTAFARYMLFLRKNVSIEAIWQRPALPRKFSPLFCFVLFYSILCLFYSVCSTFAVLSLPCLADVSVLSYLGYVFPVDNGHVWIPGGSFEERQSTSQLINKFNGRCL